MEGLDTYTASTVRPLNITNTDNRIICSAVRCCIEPAVAPGISQCQRGFIRGRSMLSNLKDVEEAMLHHSLMHDNAAVVFFDFQAAFPSVCQDFLLEAIVSRGWPPWCARFIQALYTNNRRSIIAGGGVFEGFTLTAGVRLGCPFITSSVRCFV